VVSLGCVTCGHWPGVNPGVKDDIWLVRMARHPTEIRTEQAGKGHADRALQLKSWWQGQGYFWRADAGSCCQARMRRWQGAPLLPWMAGMLPRLRVLRSSPAGPCGGGEADTVLCAPPAGRKSLSSAREKVGPEAGRPDACWRTGQLPNPL